MARDETKAELIRTRTIAVNRLAVLERELARLRQCRCPFCRLWRKTQK